MRIERLWDGRLIAFVVYFQTCSSSCHQPPVTNMFSSAYVCVCSHCIVITLIVAMVAKHTMKKQVMLHLFDCAELGGIWDEDLCHPLSNIFLPNLVVPFFCGADLCEFFCRGHSSWGGKTHKQNPPKIPGQSCENLVMFYSSLVFLRSQFKTFLTKQTQKATSSTLSGVAGGGGPKLAV